MSTAPLRQPIPKPDRIDPITTSVIQGALENIAIEMGYKLMRMSYSSIIRESEDFGAALVDGRLTASGQRNDRAAAPLEVLGLARRHGRDAGETPAFLCELWFGAADRKLVDRIKQAAGMTGGEPGDQLRAAASAMLAGPEAQLG